MKSEVKIRMERYIAGNFRFVTHFQFIRKTVFLVNSSSKISGL
jgi:hypothetical protein